VTLCVEDARQARRDARGFVAGDRVFSSKTDADVVPTPEKSFTSHWIEHERTVPSGVRYLDGESFHVDDEKS
jgi:hypothetical protein